MIIMLNNVFESQVGLISKALQPDDNLCRQLLQPPFSRTLGQRLKRRRPGFNFPTSGQSDEGFNFLLHELPEAPVRAAAWLVELAPGFGASSSHASLQEPGVNQLPEQPNLSQWALSPRAQEGKIKQ